MADDVITMLTTDHHELQRLFDMMKKDSSSRPLALPLAVAMLEAHSEAEEDRVYPAVAREAEEKAEAEHAAEEHHEAENLGKHLLEMDWESGEFDLALEEWISAVLHHVEEEENEILPALREAVDADRLHQLGMEFADARSRKLAGQPLIAASGDTVARSEQGTEAVRKPAAKKTAARKAPPKAARASATARGRGGAKSELRQLSKAQLYQRATEQGIAGRSKMSREELVDALARAGRRR
ncbi:hemerythrin domain-containing protein [Streptomyces sp. NPDC047009]|uniref:hemerythrin domain-containing protein n=1 Tax=unclassified Streptomyces TaxID=2593676 RepID=UPI0033E2D9A1